MSFPSNGITPAVIREMMPPYHLDNDLLGAMFAALPPPPPDASAAWRRARIIRLMHEISTLVPANAAQARIATEIVVTRALADTITARAYAPDLTMLQMCRVARSAAEVRRTAIGLERLLARHQQLPVPFFGTVLADEVDVAAVDAVWCGAGVGAEAVPGIDAGAEAVGDVRPGADEVAEDAGECGDLTAGTAAAWMAVTSTVMTEPAGVVLAEGAAVVTVSGTETAATTAAEAAGTIAAETAVIAATLGMPSVLAAPALPCVTARLLQDAGVEWEIGVPV